MTLDRIAVVVLSWNTCRYTLECLDSLIQQEQSHIVYIVDNASNDGTAEAVASRFPSAHLIINAENLGFAGGNNVGVDAAFIDGADAVLVLNNDTTLESDAIARLVAAADAYPTAGILNPLILFARPPHRVWFAGATLEPWMGRSVHHPYDIPRNEVASDIQPLIRATGCAMLITRTCYECIGGFDESLFLYFEDVDYSLRARDAGFEIFLVPQAIVYHYVSAAAGHPKSASTMYYATRNGIALTDRHFSLPMPARAIRRLLIACAQVGFLVHSPRALSQLPAVLAGYLDARRGCLGPYRK